MKKLFASLKSTLAIAVLAVVMFSCSSSPEQVKYIPKDANFVVVADVKSIGVKSLDFKELFSLKTIKKAMSDEKAENNSVEKIKNSGIDLLNTAYVFGQASDQDFNYGALLVALSDKDKFDTFVKGLDKKYTVAEENGFKIATSSVDKNEIIVWNDKTAIFMEQGPAEKGNAKDKALSFFNLKKEDALAENDKNFSALQKETADISVWVNFEKFAKLFKDLDSKIDTKETYLNASCNFENGQIVVNSKYFVNKGLAEKIYLSKGSSINKDIVGAVPGKSVLAMYGLSLDINKVFTLLQQQNMTAGLEQNLQAFGLTSNDLKSMLSGDLVATFNGITMKEEMGINYMTGAEEMRKVPYPEFSVLIGINDKNISAKLLSALEQNKVLTKEGNSYVAPNQTAYVADKGSYLILASPGLKASVDGSGDKLKSELSSLLSDNSGSLYIDLSGIIASIPEEQGGLLSMFIGDYKKNLAEFEAFTVTGTELKDNIAEGKFVLSFKNKDQNSLVTLAKMSDQIAEEQTQKMGSSEITTEPTEEKVPMEPMEVQ